MNIPVKWLETYIDFAGDTLDQIANKLTMSGTKVEAIHKIGYDLSGVVVGKILSIDPHPDAEKLVVTQIDVGAETLQIVTGANNISVGDYIPVATPGANLHGGLKIKPTKLRGVPSNGMLCSVEEMGGSRDDYPEAPADGIYIFSRPYELGIDAVALLELRGEVLELELTSNRPDCYSIKGIVRELSALGYKRKDTPVDEGPAAGASEPCVVRDDHKTCKRYMLKEFVNVKVGPSPQWLRRRLSMAGIRPINNVVDVTNYVMWEFGQPLHAFDADTLVLGEEGVIVRSAVEGEKITVLDGSEVTLKAGHLVIADAQKPIAIAGIMGGLTSGVTEKTTRIYLESANFDGPHIRQTTKDVGFRTDASTKYEKGIDPSLSGIALARFTELIAEIGGADSVAGQSDIYPEPVVPHTISYTTEGVNKLLGTQIPEVEMTRILTALEIETDGQTATIPTFRKDMEGQADVAEEIIRMYGFDAIDYTVDHVFSIGRKNKKQTIEAQLRTLAVSMGLNEIMTYSFESPAVFDQLNQGPESPLRQTLTLNNPQGENSIMRTSLVGGVLNALAYNYNRRNMSVQLFEMAKVYRPAGPEISEPLVLTLGGYEKNVVDFYHIKGMIETILDHFAIEGAEFQGLTTGDIFHPSRAAVVRIGDEVIASLGELHPLVTENYGIKERVYVANLYVDVLIAHAKLTKHHEEISKYPAITRDIAVKVKTEVQVGDLVKAIKAKGKKVLEQVELFDIYTGDRIEAGYKSVAYSLTFRDKTKSLEDSVIDPIMANIIETLETNFGAELRK